jgi:hypothetical protein
MAVETGSTRASTPMPPEAVFVRDRWTVAIQTKSDPCPPMSRFAITSFR